MWELFVLGSIGFWTLIVISNIILLYCAENNCGGLATVAVIGSLCLLNWFGQIPVFWYIGTNPWVILPSIAAYFVVGTIWSVAKWFLYVKDQREQYDELKQKFIEANHLEISINDPIPDEFKDQWHRSVYSYYDDSFKRYSTLDVYPKVGEHKMQIYVWITYWPWSLFWTMINDPVRKIFNRIYVQIAGWLQSISDSYFKDTEQDFKKKRQ